MNQPALRCGFDLQRVVNILFAEYQGVYLKDFSQLILQVNIMPNILEESISAR